MALSFGVIWACALRVVPSRPNSEKRKMRAGGPAVPYRAESRSEKAGRYVALAESESGGSFEAAAEEINADFRRRLSDIRRSPRRHEIPLAIRALRELRAAAMAALRREFKQKRRAASRPGAEVTGQIAPVRRTKPRTPLPPDHSL